MSANDLLPRLLADDTLIAGWIKVRSNAGGPGADGVSIERFGADLLVQLHRLREQVREGRYVPQPLLRAEIRKESGKVRRLSIPSVRDRVLQSAACLVLTPILEKEFEDESWAYRPGRSVQMAVARVARLRDEGFRWVVDADIQSYFDEIDHDTLLGKLAVHVADDVFLALVRNWMQATVRELDGSHSRLTKGIPQGSPISPLLANLYLDELDEAVIDDNHRLVRFADDFLILCRDEAEAREALALTERTVDRLKLALNPEKTRITHFDEGFRFLGVDFLRDTLAAADPDATPWVLPDSNHGWRQPRDDKSAAPLAAPPLRPEPEEESEDGPRADPTSAAPAAAPVEIEELAELAPLLRTAYLLEQGLTLSRVGDRLAISREGLAVSEIPVHKLDQIILHGNSMVSTAALRLCGEAEVAVHFADWKGQCWGALDSHRSSAVELHRLQHAHAADPDFPRAMARALVAAKIANSRVVLRRYLRNHPLQHGEFHDLEIAAMQHGALAADSLDAIRGHEGMAARIYFGALADMLPEEWGFAGRTRNPPTDPVNAMLSYGYAILFANIGTLIRRRGLDPHIGHLHALRDGHAALVSDFMEEFRAPVVDATVLQLVFMRRIHPAEFIREEGSDLPCRLSDDARKRLIHAIEAKLNAGMTHPVAGHRADWRRAMHYQVWHYARVLAGSDPEYLPCIVR